MRNPSRTLLVVVLMASLLLPPGLPLAGAAKVDPSSRTTAKSLLLVGDSLSIGLGRQLETILAGRPGISFAHLGKVSSGLANPAFFNWETQLAAQVGEHHPDVVLIMLGANDNKNLPSGDGRSLTFGSKEWAAAYAARLTRLHAIIRADNAAAKVYFIGVPVMADPAFEAEMSRVNAVLAATAKALPGSAYIETRDVLADATGSFAAQGQGPDGTVVRLRAEDGVHISGAGSKLLAARCLSSVSDAAGLPGTELLASLQDRAVRPLGKAGAGQTPARIAQDQAVAQREAKPATTVAIAAKPAVAPTPGAAATVKSAPPSGVSLAAVRPTPSTVPTAGAYSVADGDTLWSVAKRLGVSPEQLATANPGIDPRHMSIGQPLAVPASRPLAQAASTVQASAQVGLPSSRTHTVADGDNFWSVARRHDVSVAALTQANPGVDPTRLRIGQSLALPGTEQPGALQADAGRANPVGAYTVADGDNFWSIAHRLGVDVAELKRANNGVDPQKLRPGQVLALPGSVRASADQPQSPLGRESSRAAGDAGLYPVAKGDTLWSLSRRFGVSFETMLSVNGEIDPVRLQVGQLVTIPGGGQPVASAEALLFPVSAGDTLWGIARRFDVSVEALTAANPGVDPLRLREGQTLRVPSSLAAVAAPTREAEKTAPLPVVSGDVPRLHSVVTGDTLWNLARHYGISVDQILEENAGIDPVRLRVGQAVRLPGTGVAMAAR